MTNLDHEIAQVLAKLSICSEVSAANMDSSSRDSGEDIGGKRPPGGIDHKGNREREWPLKDVSHFRRRLECAHSEAALQAILVDAERALEAWQQLPRWKRGEQEPDRKTLRWKRMIADSYETAEKLSKRHEISIRMVRYYREQYGENIAA